MVGIEAVSQQMNFAIQQPNIDLYARPQNRIAGGCQILFGLVVSGQSVVVGDGQPLQTNISRLVDQL